MIREQRREWRRDIKRRKAKRKEPKMLAREKWQIKTIAVLEKVFEERCRQMEKHGDAMASLADGTGPNEPWALPISGLTATSIQADFREDYDERRGDAEYPGERLTRMHLVREELAEAFELSGNDPAFVDEILQVAALCVQWAEYKVDSRGNAEDLI